MGGDRFSHYFTSSAILLIFSIGRGLLKKRRNDITAVSGKLVLRIGLKKIYRFYCHRLSSNFFNYIDVIEKIKNKICDWVLNFKILCSV